MVMADEMGADWERVKIVQADGDEPKYGNQDTDGSRSHAPPHPGRCARSAPRCATMLARRRPSEWGVEPSAVHGRRARGVTGPVGQALGFGELAEAAMKLPVPALEELAFKDEADFRYIGKGKVPITDLHDITIGKAVYGADVRCRA